MSVTFDANIDEAVDQDTLFTFSYNRILKDPENKIHELIDQKYDGDIDYYFWQDEQKSGGKTLSEWIAIFDEFGDLTRTRNIDADDDFDGYDREPSFTARGSDGSEFYFSLYPVYEKFKYSVQMSNRNARSVLQLLGFDSEELLGSSNPIAFLKRIESVKGSRMIDEFTISPRQEERIHDAGVSRDYLEHSLLALEKLADYCIMKECDISWG